MKSLLDKINENMLTFGLPRNEADFKKEKDMLEEYIKDAESDIRTYSMFVHSNKFRNDKQVQFRYNYGIKRAELEIEMYKELIKYLDKK